MTDDAEVHLPAWLAKLIVLSMEKAYRRGFQHGIHQPRQGFLERNGLKPLKDADLAVTKWRYALSVHSLRDLDRFDPERIKSGTPYQPLNHESIADRHLRYSLDDGLAAGVDDVWVSEPGHGEVVVRRFNRS